MDKISIGVETTSHRLFKTLSKRQIHQMNVLILYYDKYLINIFIFYVNIFLN